jgi:sugar/nucleoside kinase (ribokinase family)
MFPTGPVTVIFMGTTVIDRILEIEEFPGPNGTAVVTSWAREFGGRAAAPAATYAALGGRARLLSAVGSDFTSSGFEDFLVASGVDIDLVAREVTDECYITNTYIEALSRETFTCFEPRALGHSISEVQIDTLSHADALYIAGYYSHDGLSSAAQAVFDSKVPLALGLCNGIVPYASRDLLRALIRCAHVISFNDAEWHIIMNRLAIASETELFDMAESLECIYHTRGASSGSGFLRIGVEFEIPVRRVKECVSTVGAGDTFMAGFLYGRRLGLDYVDSARTGSLLASIKVESSLGSTFALSDAALLEEKLTAVLREAGIRP